MRITQAAKKQTRQRILAEADRLFASGYGEVSTRAIAQAAGIATGTLFNYFPTKECLGFALIQGATEAAEQAFAKETLPPSLEETLFSYVAGQLRALEPMRPWIPEVLESALSPLRAEKFDGPATFRREHLERVHGWIEQELGSGAERSVELHLYWSLYLGVLSFWAHDESEHQAATLALLDRSMRLFVRTLKEDSL